MFDFEAYIDFSALNRPKYEKMAVLWFEERLVYQPCTPQAGFVAALASSSSSGLFLAWVTVHR